MQNDMKVTRKLEEIWNLKKFVKDMKIPISLKNFKAVRKGEE